MVFDSRIQLEFHEIRDMSALNEHETQNHVAQLNNGSYMQFSRHGLYSHTRETTDSFIKELILQGGRFFLVRSGEEMVGTMTLKWLEQGIRSIGILIYQQHSSKGFATLAINYGIRTSKSEGAIFAQVGTDISNFALRRIMEKLGFELCNFSNIQNLYEIYGRKLLSQDPK